MKYSSKNIKKTLKNQIEELSKNANNYCKSPSKDFTRNRKLPFEKVVQFMLTKSGKSLNCEILDFFDFNSNAPTSSAFVQQRDKINYVAFEDLFHKFTDSIKEEKLFKGYRLLAVDGSDLHVPTNKNEATFYPGTNAVKSHTIFYI